MSQLVTEGLITLYQLDCSPLNGPMHYFASASDFDRQVVWGGNEYTPLPMEAAGFETTTKGPPAQPTVTISNMYGAANMLLETYNGLVGAQLGRIVTLARFLDDGATPDPNAFITWDRYTVAQKMSHNAVAIVFRLATAIDQQGVQLPRRVILRDVCSHVYRRFDGTGFDYSRATCPYTGGGCWDTNNNATSPQADQCARNLRGCQLRFPNQPLPARFFPGVGKVR